MIGHTSPPAASSPLGFITRADEELTHVRARSGPTLERVRPGVYVDRAAWATLAPWDRYLVRVHAFALSHPGAVFCFESAAALQRLPIFGEPRDIHVFDHARTRSRRFGDVLVHTGADSRRIVGDGPYMTSRDITALDLARVLPPAFALAVVDAVLRQAGPALSVAELRDLSRSQAARRGRARVEWVLPRADPTAESPGESVSRAVIEWLGFPEPELQQRFVSGGVEDRVDFLWRRWLVIGESDGYAKYTAAGGDPLSALRREKTREDRLRRYVDGFARWDWGDAMRATPLQTALLTAGLPQLYAPQPGLLATLRSHPRSR
ncbi:hypothetical protein DEU34_0482 [Microbacterium sp. AG1240]|uniref:hypothetical protein n=1 Tax=Microbacterium sp. AG1240 TaxID=2183992 RepID=UPI000EB471C1|nr:hypothetical protein [Microbacterium sp. AG1240]RKT35976.1 hypothetical protein DEU34_0482 [Microbacterium sp. AG1240]